MFKILPCRPQLRERERENVNIHMIKDAKLKVINLAESFIIMYPVAH